MGWRSWNALALDIDEAKILAQVRALKQRGPGGAPSLLELGYAEVGVDDGWQACGAGANGSFHDAAGRPIVNETRFPDIGAMVRAIHDQGVKVGWYHNNCYCKEAPADTSGGHPAQDVQQVVDAGFDGLKIDGCGPAHAMSKWAQQISASGAEIVVENCANNGAELEWRMASPADIEDSECRGFHFYRISHSIGPSGKPAFSSAMWNLQLMLPFLGARPLSRPGCWAYPDMLQVGHLPSLEESRTHFGAWCITSSPLVLGLDLTDAAALEAVYPVVGNAMAIRVNQEYAGHPGTLACQSSSTFASRAYWSTNLSAPVTLPEWQVWRKPQAGRALAVLVVNLAGRAQDVAVPAACLGLSDAAEYQVTDVWAQAVLHRRWTTSAAGQLSFERIPPHGSVFWRLEHHEAPGEASRDWTLPGIIAFVVFALMAIAAAAVMAARRKPAPGASSDDEGHSDGGSGDDTEGS